MAAVLLEGGAEAADEGVEAAPGLAERAGAGSRGLWVPEERAAGGVDLGLPELVEVAEELQNMSPAATGKCQWWPVVL